MDIKTIEDNIQALESADTTVDNVAELASLYIVRDKLVDAITTPITAEFQDILPEFLHYINVKTKFQRHEITEEAIISSLSILCKEIEQFLQMLYSSTDCYKERKLIYNMIENISNKISK